MFVLITKHKTYFVDYRITSFIISESVKHAMVFKKKSTAEQFKIMLFLQCKLETIIEPI